MNYEFSNLITMNLKMQLVKKVHLTESFLNELTPLIW